MLVRCSTFTCISVTSYTCTYTLQMYLYMYVYIYICWYIEASEGSQNFKLDSQLTVDFIW